MTKYKILYEKYKHVIPAIIYFPIYMIWFGWLEKNVTKGYTVIHVDMDDHIPFWEVFVVPYLLWFVYVSLVVIFLFFKDKSEYYRACTFLFTGMTVFLIVSTLWPNGHHLRLEEMPRDNIFTRLISLLWSTDTATNLWPSIHTYNSLGAHFAIIRSRHLENKKGIKIASAILCLSIILSTVLIKQHSMFDLVTAVIMGAIMYVIVYRKDVVLAARMQHQKEQAPQTL